MEVSADRVASCVSGASQRLGETVSFGWVQCSEGAVASTLTRRAGHTVNDGVLISNVTTKAPYRKRGIATAMTLRAAHDGFAPGATYAYLFSSPAALSAYERIGFRELEAWRTWTV